MNIQAPNRLRRLTLQTLALAAGALAISGAAHAAPAIDVVKIMAFSCPVCRAAEAQDRVIDKAVTAIGGHFTYAPLPTDAAESGAKERVFYASRTDGSQLSERVKETLYKGMQDLTIPLGEMPQVFVYFQQQLSDLPPAQFADLFKRAGEPAAHGALSRAARLASATGASALPTYVVLADGVPVISLDPNSVPGGSLTALREEVLSRVQKLSKE